MIPLRDLNRSQRFPLVTVGLIVLNALFFLYELSLGERLESFLMQAAFVPAKTFGEGPGAGLDFGLASGLFSMFLHGGWMHFIGNMLFLWIFGDNVEDLLGHVRYLAFYLLCGYAATFAHAFANPGSTMPAIGASGAIAGVLGAYVVLFPGARVVTLIFLGFFYQMAELPAILYLGLWFVMQFFSGVASLAAETTAAQGGVAWFAHIGGFVAGPVFYFLLGGRRPRRGEFPARRPPYS